MKHLFLHLKVYQVVVTSDSEIQMKYKIIVGLYKRVTDSGLKTIFCELKKMNQVFTR